MLTHVVHFSFTDPADAVEAKRLLEGLLGQVPSLHSLTAALHTGEDPDAAQLALITTHDDLAGLEAYAVHPAHLEVAQWIKPRRSFRSVVDYVS